MIGCFYSASGQVSEGIVAKVKKTILADHTNVIDSICSLKNTGVI